jgi:hypothetical protein
VLWLQIHFSFEAQVHKEGTEPNTKDSPSGEEKALLPTLLALKK